jgi:protein-disulfide isomerase
MKMKFSNFLYALCAVSFLVACQPKKATDAEKTAPKITQKSTDKAAAKGGESTKLPVGTSYSKGPKDALVTIVEFSEFQCPFCTRVLPTLKKIHETYKDDVRVVFKHNPLPFHKDAPLAAQAALAAGEQGKFWEMHDLLFTNTKTLKEDNLNGYAKKLGLDMTKFAAALKSEKTKKMVAADQALARKVGARGTPHFFINGKRLSGAQPFDNFKKEIDAQLVAAKALVAKGTARNAVYAALADKNFAPAKPRKPRGGGADDSKTVYKIPAGNSYAKGGNEPLVTIIEFSEFQCPFCTRANPTIKKIMEEYGDKVRIVFKHNPLPFHKDAPGAAKAALAAGEQGKFWEMHDLLFTSTKKLKPANLTEYATKLGLDMAKFDAAMKNPKLDAAIKADQKLGQQFGARGTPHFFVNGRRLAGAQPFANFKKLIDEEVKKAEALLKKGTPRGKLYAALTAKGATKAAAPKKQQRPADDTKTVYKMPADQAFSKGPADALVTIVEFSEFQCPFCTRVLPTLSQIHKTYKDKVRVVFRHNPLPFHKDAPLAAQAAIAAGEQGKFWEMHDLLFTNTKTLKEDNLNGYAKKLGLDMAKFSADLKSPKAKSMIKRDQQLASTFGARGTPNFFINGRKVTGARPFPAFKTIIDEELKKAEALLKKGTPKANIYAELTKNGKTKAAAPAARKAPKEDKTVYTVPVSANDMVKGGKNAKITIVEFSEFQCPFCSRVNPTISKIQKEYGDKVRVVFKHNPLSFHKDAPLAAEAALAAAAQGKGWEMHDILFKNQKALKRAQLEKYATELGLNMAQFKGDLDAGKFKAQVAADQKLAANLKARGTPHFFINGRRLRGAQPFPRFKALIDEMLKK